MQAQALALALASSFVVALALVVDVAIVVGGDIPSPLTCTSIEYLFYVQTEDPLNDQNTFSQTESLFSVQTTTSYHYQ